MGFCETLVKNISSETYFDEVSEQIKNAKKSIYIVLSDFSCRTNDPENKVLNIIKTLTLAYMEGININVVFNASNHIMLSASSDSVKDYGYELLKTSNVPVSMIKEPVIYSTLIIIDNSTVIEGTQPFVSNIDFRKNYYSNTLINSPELAVLKLKELNSWNIAENAITGEFQFTGKYYHLSDNIINKKFFNLVLKSNENTLFDFYLLLLLQHAAKQKEWFYINGPDILSKIDSKTRTKIESRKIVNDYLEKLSKLDLLKFEQNESEDIKISILTNNSKSNYFKIPANFFLFDCLKDMVLLQKVIYLLILDASTKTGKFPVFEMDEKLEKYFMNMKAHVFKDNLIKLEKNLLIEPAYSSNLSLNVPAFIILDPKDKVATDKGFAILKHQYGEEKVEKARFMAAQFNKEKDSELVKDVLYYIEELSFMEVQKIFKYVYELPLNSAQRNFIEIKKNMAKRLFSKLDSKE